MINTATLPPAATGNNGPIRSPSPAPRAHTHTHNWLIYHCQPVEEKRDEGGEGEKQDGEWCGGGGGKAVVRIKPPTHPPPYRFYYSGIASRQKSLTAGLRTNATVCVSVCVRVCVHHNINLGWAEQWLHTRTRACTCARTHTQIDADIRVIAVELFKMCCCD